MDNIIMFIFNLTSRISYLSHVYNLRKSHASTNSSTSVWLNGTNQSHPIRSAITCKCITFLSREKRLSCVAGRSFEPANEVRTVELTNCYTKIKSAPIRFRVKMPYCQLLLPTCKHSYLCTHIHIYTKAEIFLVGATGT